MTISGNHEDKPAVRAYDFRRPERLTSETRVALHSEQQRLAKMLSVEMADHLRMDCTVESQDFAEDRSDSLLETSEDSVFSLGSPSWQEPVLFQIESSLGQAFIERLLGGVGVARQVERDPTEIEIALLGKIAEGVCRRIGEVWSSGQASEAEVRFLNSDARSEFSGRLGVRSSFEVSWGDASGPLRVLYPYDVVETALGLNRGRASGQEPEGSTDRRMTPELIGNVKLRVNVRFPAAPVQIREVTSLQVGDVLHLRQSLADRVEVRVGGRPVFLGFPGTVQDSMGVQIGGAL